ncbi:MAG: hypothetical protein CME62_05895 [Halobacteriovoraceae bacterium]|nr:hypothetical protein [Halobacteriovoraceae bacterium]|tara:strand:+ start:1616 stop:5704 length:4089 start_codon:yes stop_codon:yes gene_type:complete
MNYQISTIKMTEYPEWNISFCELYHEYFKAHDLELEISRLIHFVRTNEFKNNFRWHVEVGGIQLIAGIFPKDQTIRLASKNLQFELTLIGLDENISDGQLKEFAESIAKIPVEHSPSEIEYLSCVYDLPTFTEGQFSGVNEAEQVLTEKLVEELKDYKQSLFEKVSDFALDLTANFLLIRVHLLKFLAILPCLDHDKKGQEVKRTFLEAMRRLVSDSKKAKESGAKGQARALPDLYVHVAQLVYSVCKYIPPKMLAYLIRRSTSIMAKRFIAGVDINNAKSSIKSLLNTKRDITIDQLGELVVSKKEADHYCDQVIQIIEGIDQSIPKGSQNASGVNKAHISIKVTALTHDFKPQDFEYTYKTISPRLSKILLSAHKHDVFINIDAEHYHYRDCVFEVYKKVLLETDELKDYRQTGIVLQAYLKDAYVHFQEILELAQTRNIPMPIRLVKGAYWDAETIEATAHNFEAPEFLNKEETDIHFRQLVFKSLENHEYIKLAIASHNIKDHCFGEVLRDKLFPEAAVIEHQCLHMTYEALSMGMAKLDWPVRNYIPVGDLLVGMAYLVRRIMENSSQVGVLTIMRSHNKSIDFKTPLDNLSLKMEQKNLEYENSISEISKVFKNIYPLRSYLAKHRKLIQTELHLAWDKLQKKQPLLNVGEIPKVCSSAPELVVGTYDYTDVSEVNQKIDQLFDYFKNHYKGYDNSQRLIKLSFLAQLLLCHRERLTVLIMLEAGKTIDEAIADVDEAIDFINFYVTEQLKLERENECYPRGVIGVIAPWNFPLAIPCGMTVSALAAGNSVVLKPAEQTPLIAIELVKLCREAGITEDELQIVIGEAEVGQAIVGHSKINGIVFTGSKPVGESIYKNITGQVSDSAYPFPIINKFAITEMGGKNAIIITNNCELDETVAGVLYAAFAHAGQKCSAASRLIIDEKVKEAFVDRFKQAVKDVSVGKSTIFSTMINPLITEEDQKRVRKMAAEARAEVEKFGGRVIIDRSQEDVPGFCVGPSVFELDKKTVLSQNTVATREVFGPVIHLIPYKDLDEAVEIFNSTEYALTGGIFCQSQDDIDYIAPRLLAGNIYINRPNTGARVAIEPFGGFKMSGSGPKAGGVDYLSKFNQMKNRDLNRDNSVFDVESADSSFFLQYSGLSLERRIYNTKRLLAQVIGQFEVFFKEITEEDKEKLIKLQDAINNNEFNLSDIEFANRYIPGQISFSKRDLPLGVGCLIETCEKLNIQVVLDFFINLLVGNGINIFCTNEKAFETWERIVELAYLNGFSSFNLNLVKVSRESLLTALESNEFHFCILSNINNSGEFVKVLLNKEDKDYLVRVIYAGQNENWAEGIVAYTHCRAFAINTMRHGAPLEISI